MTAGLSIAGQPVDELTFRRLTKSASDRPAADMLGWLAGELGLNADALTAEQATGLAEFIHLTTI